MTSNLIAASLLIFVGAAGCNKSKAEQSMLRSLYQRYQQGSIAECRLHGQLVYTAGINAYDASTEIFDSSGKQIGNCNYAWGKPDSICKELQSCVTVYRCKDHITGQPFVDKYGLSK